MQQESSQRKLLLVDDDEACRFLVSEILKRTKIKIIEASNGVNARELYKRYSAEIVLVILDICLPGYDGFGLLKQIRRVNPCVPAIALSALTPDLLETEWETAGFDAFIPKPFEPHQFYQTVISFLKEPKQHPALV